jgi:hypothetical protein
MKLNEVSKEEQERNLEAIRNLPEIKGRIKIIDGAECMSLDDSRHSCKQCYDCKLYKHSDIRQPVNRSCPKFKYISDEIWTGEETCPYFTSID